MFVPSACACAHSFPACFRRSGGEARRRQPQRALQQVVQQGKYVPSRGGNRLLCQVRAGEGAPICTSPLDLLHHRPAPGTCTPEGTQWPSIKSFTAALAEEVSLSRSCTGCDHLYSFFAPELRWQRRASCGFNRHETVTRRSEHAELGALPQKSIPCCLRGGFRPKIDDGPLF